MKMMRDFMTDNGIASDVAERIYKVEGADTYSIVVAKIEMNMVTTSTDTSADPLLFNLIFSFLII